MRGTRCRLFLSAASRPAALGTGLFVPRTSAGLSLPPVCGDRHQRRFFAEGGSSPSSADIQPFEYGLNDDPAEALTRAMAHIDDLSRAVAEIKKQREQDREALGALVRRTGKLGELIDQLSANQGEGNSSTHPGAGASVVLEEQQAALQAKVESLEKENADLRNVVANVKKELEARILQSLPMMKDVPVQGVDPELLRSLVARVQMLESKQFMGSPRIDKLATHLSQAQAVKGLDPISLRIDKETNSIGITGSRVEVANVPPYLTAVDVRTHMERAGVVLSCLKSTREKIVKGADGAQTTALERTMIVTYASVHDAVRAIENLDHTHLGNYVIRVQPFLEPEMSNVMSSALPEEKEVDL
jgi:hypothetical protein